MIPESLRDAFQLIANGDPYTLSVIYLSLKVAAASLGLGILIGLPIGLGLGMTRFAGRLGFLILVNSAMGLPPVVAGLLTFMVLRNQGILGGANLLFTPEAMVYAQVPLAAPLVAGITMAAIAGVPQDLRLQVRGLGAGRLQEAWILMKQTRSSLLAACIAGFGVTISEVGAILIVGGNLLLGGQNYTRTMTTAIVLETRLGNFPRALAFALILFTLIVLVNVFLTRAQLAKAPKWER
ncbi:MAG: ABC transporter permease [Acidimicrobiia bacterium]